MREVVAFCFPPEDILPGGGVEDMLAGGCAHRSRQEQQTGEVERAIRHSFSLRGESVELYGRMDAFTDGPVPLVEEMKLRPPYRRRAAAGSTGRRRYCTRPWRRWKKNAPAWNFA